LDLSGGKRVKFDDHLDTSTLRHEQSMKLDEIATILNKDGGLLNMGVVEHLVQFMPNDPQEGTSGRKLAPDVMVAHHSMFAKVIVTT
jgi:acetate kinase